MVYLASFFATSFVEEEHELWFFGTAGLALWLGMRSVYSSGLPTDPLLMFNSSKVLQERSNVLDDTGHHSEIDESMVS